MKARRTGLAVALMSVAFIVVGALSARAQIPPPATLAAHRDPVARLLQRIAAGDVTLDGSDDHILRTLLRELEVPVASQMAVFSRTSMQAGRISPANPRVVYFSDSTYVGWVPGGLIEVAAIDPEQGVNFYAFDPQDARDRRRTLVRETSCLRCHGNGMMEQNPALFARSVPTTAQGEPLRQHGSDFITEQTPFERRWGGWYVTGYEGRVSHRGNAFSREHHGQLDFTPSVQRPADLSAVVDPARYLAPTSDVVALLVFEHQMAVQNSILRAGQNVRRALRTGHSDQAALHSVLASSAEDVLDHLLFRGAAPLPDGVKGSDAFARAFVAGAPRSKQGHSLKDLALSGRLFANRCSFLIYSGLFAALPELLQERIFASLEAALQNDDASGRYGYLEKEERRRILGVLQETLPHALGRARSKLPGPKD